MAESSSETAVVAEATPVAPAQDVTPADSSPAETGVERPLLDVVADALRGKEEAPASETGIEKPESEPLTTDKDSDPDELTPDELKLLSEKAQKRFRQLANISARERERAEGLEPKAKLADDILGYLETHGIEPTEFDNSLEITRLIKGHEYQRAYDVLTPIYQELSRRAGKVLPQELNERVRLGYLPETDARELQEARARAATAETREQQRQARAAEEQKQQQARQDQERVVTIATAVDEWAKTKAGTDPDWTSKQSDLTELYELEVWRRGYPQNSKDAIALAETVLKTVETKLKRFVPQPTARRAVTGQFASPRATAKPTSPFEAVNIALSKLG